MAGTGLPTWGTVTWEEAVGIPEGGYIVLASGAASFPYQTAPYVIGCRNASHYRVNHESSFPDELEWIVLEDGGEYTFPGEGEVRLFAQFRNPGRFDPTYIVESNPITIQEAEIGRDGYDLNIKLSVQRQIRLAFAEEFGYSFCYEDPKFDATKLDRWGDISWGPFEGRNLCTAMFSCRCFSRPSSDRFGRDMEVMVGRLTSALNIRSVPFLDFVDTPTDPQPVLWEGVPLEIAIRRQTRDSVQHAPGVGPVNEGAPFGVHQTTLHYRAYAPRPSLVP